ncbi:MAG: hypothetical protein COA74_10225 [Gammaproteobacteria bacterium]|nr:MAG: hypothetical protein COA74_10225 [Gammaproteobacteria bacterium]
MVIKSTKLRRFALGTQFIAGIGLLTASYLTTESGWTNQVLNTAVQSELPVVNSAIKNFKSSLSC